MGLFLPVIKKIWFRQVLVIKELWCFLNLFYFILFIVIMKTPYNSLLGAIEKTGMHMNIFMTICRVDIIHDAISCCSSVISFLMQSLAENNNKFIWIGKSLSVNYTSASCRRTKKKKQTAVEGRTVHIWIHSIRLFDYLRF
jgi:hypothetical protein